MRGFTGPNAVTSSRLPRASWSIVAPERAEYLSLFYTKAITKQLQAVVIFGVLTPSCNGLLQLLPAPVLLDSSTCSSLDIAQTVCN